MTDAKRVTIADIARMAGVSPGAVSFAVNNRPGLSEETRERILNIVRETKWRPSSAARALVGSRTNVVGLALARPARSIGAEAFFTDLIAGIESRLSQQKVALQLRLVRDLAEEVETHRNWFASSQVDGVIMIDPRDDDPRLAAIAERGTKAVMIGSRPTPPGTAPAVWIDDAAVATSLFEYILALGHTHVAYVTGSAALEHVALRVATLMELAGDDATAEPVETDFSPGAAEQATRKLLSRRKNRPTAIVYDNDVMALAGLRVAQEMRCAVPADVSIASFDDSVVAGLVNPSITAMTRDTFDLGEKAATLLLEHLDSDQPSWPGPVPTLSVRESTAPPAHRA